MPGSSRRGILGERGYDAVVLEARDCIGGRAYSMEFAGAGRTVELGGAWFDADWQTVMREEAVLLLSKFFDLFRCVD